MKPVRTSLLISIVIVAGVLALATSKRAAAQPGNASVQTPIQVPLTAVPQRAAGEHPAKLAHTQIQPPSVAPARSQVVVLEATEYYTYAQTASNMWTSGYAGYRVNNSSSSVGAPTFPNLAYAYTSG